MALTTTAYTLGPTYTEVFENTGAETLHIIVTARFGYSLRWVLAASPPDDDVNTYHFVPAVSTVSIPVPPSALLYLKADGHEAAAATVTSYT